MTSLSPTEAKEFYDRFGSRQDRQGFYEDAALDRLIRYGDFASSRRVFELGCGTGRLAHRLLTHELPEESFYVLFWTNDAEFASESVFRIRM